MTEIQSHLEDKVVASFKNELSDATRKVISDAELNKLAAIVREALSEELEETAEMIEGLAKKIRNSVKRPDLDL